MGTEARAQGPWAVRGTGPGRGSSLPRPGLAPSGPLPPRSSGDTALLTVEAQWLACPNLFAGLKGGVLPGTTACPRCRSTGYLRDAGGTAEGQREREDTVSLDPSLAMRRPAVIPPQATPPSAGAARCGPHHQALWPASPGPRGCGGPTSRPRAGSLCGAQDSQGAPGKSPDRGQRAQLCLRRRRADPGALSCPSWGTWTTSRPLSGVR